MASVVGVWERAQATVKPSPNHDTTYAVGFGAIASPPRSPLFGRDRPKRAILEGHPEGARSLQTSLQTPTA